MQETRNQIPGQARSFMFCYVARMEEGRTAFKMLTGKPTGKRPLERLGVDGRTILKWTLKR